MLILWYRCSYCSAKVSHFTVSIVYQYIMPHSYSIPECISSKKWNFILVRCQHAYLSSDYLPLKKHKILFSKYQDTNIIWGGEAEIWLQQLLQCYCRIHAAKIKNDECLFTPGLHKSLRTHTCAGVRTEKCIHKCKTRANIHLKMHR